LSNLQRINLELEINIETDDLEQTTEMLRLWVDRIPDTFLFPYVYLEGSDVRKWLLRAEENGKMVRVAGHDEDTWAFDAIKEYIMT